MKSGTAWSKEEVAKLEALAGDYPRLLLFKLYRHWATQHGYQHRTNDAIKAAAYHRGISLQATGEWLTVHRIAQILGISHDCPDKCVNGGLLPASRYGSGDEPVVRYVRRKDVVALAKKSPALFGGIPAARLNCLLEDEDLAEQIATTYTRRPWYRQPVVCKETGRRFPSVREAARTVFICRQSIVYSIKTGGTEAGYHWEKAA
jgi:hypothetical protein